MGDLRPNNGGETPPEDGGGARPDDLPGFPPEWGTIVIPDDASELDNEAQALRKELRRTRRRHRWHRILGLGRTDGDGEGDGPSLGVPIVVMAVAIITTLLSLFVVTWDRSRMINPATPAGDEAAPTNLSEVTLADSGGDRVRLGDLVPAVVLLADGCDCADLIAALSIAAPTPVTIVPIGRTAPCAVGTASNVRCLADPDGTVPAHWPTTAGSGTANPGGSGGVGSPTAPVAPGATITAPPRRQATAVLFDSSQTATAPMLIDSPDDLAAGLAHLAGN